jgi:hypothetical protein
MATVWRRGESHTVLAVTADGFASRTLLEVPLGSIVEPGSATAFVLREGWDGERLRVVDSDGSSVPVTVSHAERPVRGDEVPVVVGDPQSRIVAVSADGNAHRVPTQEGLVQMHALAGRLIGTSHGDGTTYHWSEDGGAGWQSAELDGEFLPMPVWSPVGQAHAVIEGGDGATLFPLTGLQFASASAPDDWTRTPFHDQGNLTVGAAWLEDGEVRVLGTLWGPEPFSAEDAGVWRLVDGRVEKVASSGLSAADLTDVHPVAIQHVDGPVIWIPGKDGTLWRTDDGGATWERFSAR